MIHQSLKGLFVLGGQAEKIFNLKTCMFRGIIFYQLDGFPLGQVIFQYIDPDVFQL